MKKLSIIVVIFFMVANLSFASDSSSIIDQNLKKKIQEQLGLKSSITTSQLQKLDFICIDGCHISSLKGLEMASNLVTLRLYNCTIDDISDIKGLLNLKELSISACNLSSITPLSNLKNLNYLILADNKVQDISALSNCKNLKWLDLSNNHIINISAISSLNKLRYLNIRNNAINEKNLNDTLPKIKSGNTNVLVDSDVKPKDSNSMKLLNAKCKFSNFIYSKDFNRIPGILRPQLPEIPSDIKISMNYIETYDDFEYLADIAYFLVKYAIEIDQKYRPSSLMPQDEPLIKTFFSKLKLKPGIFGDEIVLGTMAGWICDNRDKFGPSALLDIEIEKYQNLKEELKKKYSTSEN